MLGGCLLLARVAGRLLVPLAAAGAMTLTLYSVHVVALGVEVGHPVGVYLVHAVAALAGAAAWQAFAGRGPLESLAARASRSARTLATHRQELS